MLKITSVFLIFALCFQRGLLYPSNPDFNTGFKDEEGYPVLLPAHSYDKGDLIALFSESGSGEVPPEPEGGYSKIRIVGNTIKEENIEKKFIKAVEDLAKSMSTESNQLAVEVSEKLKENADVIVEYSLEVDHLLWPQRRTDTLLYNSQDDFERYLKQKVVIIPNVDAPAEQKQSKLILKGVSAQQFSENEVKFRQSIAKAVSPVNNVLAVAARSSTVYYADNVIITSHVEDAGSMIIQYYMAVANGDVAPKNIVDEAVKENKQTIADAVGISDEQVTVGEPTSDVSNSSFPLWAIAPIVVGVAALALVVALVTTRLYKKRTRSYTLM